MPEPKAWFTAPFLNDAMRKYGWIVTGVPWKAFYTVGMMERSGHPEIMIHGMNGSQAHGMLVRCVQMIERGRRFLPGIHQGVAQNFPAKFVDVHPSNFHDWLGQALDYHRKWSESPLEVVQLLWCDRNGKFPGDPEYEDAFKHQLSFDVRRPEYETDLRRSL